MNITLTDGTIVSTNDVVFDSGSYRFYYGDQDITSLIHQRDKLNNWSEFDPKTASLFAYNQQQIALNKPKNTVDPYDTTGAGTSTAGNLWDQLTTDPLAAPLEAADREVKTLTANSLKSVFGSITGWLVLGAIGLYLFLKFRK